MMYLQQLVGSFFLFCGLSGGLEFNNSECVKKCNERIAHNEKLCRTTCLENSLEKFVKREYKRKLPQPVVPRVLEAKWQTIKLSFNTTELADYSGVDYILEVKPHWGYQKRDDVFNVFPYLQKYHHTQQTTYSVGELEPNTGYQFRVIAVKTNESSASKFSDWSNLTSTTKNCTNPPCGVTNIRVELTRKIPYKGMTELNSTFRWEPITPSSKFYTEGYRGNRKISRFAKAGSWCYLKFRRGDESPFEKSLKEEDFFTNEKLTTYKPENDKIPRYLYYDCWYQFELWLAKGFFLSPTTAAKRSWIFHIPDCITVNNYETCGCPYVPEMEDKTHSVLNVTVVTSNASSLAHLIWSDKLWRDDVNITYYRVTLSRTRTRSISIWSEYYDAYHNVHHYNTTISNLTTGQQYTVKLSAFHGDHCIHHDEEILHFYAISVCKNATCPANSTCRPILYTKKWECPCDEEFAWLKKEQRCIPIDKCKLYQEGCPTDSTTDNGAIIAGVVPALVAVILISVGIIVWLRYFHRKRMHFIEQEYEDALGTRGSTLTNPYDYQYPIGLEMLPGSSSKEMNLLYISQENFVIPDDLLDSICLFELPGDQIRLRSIIGRGAFGEVYIGEAQGINENPEWITVAIKTLAESVKEDVYDFLREIDLMKTLGKHENVVQMYGCCTQCRPICLVLEYAPGGNLLNYLRSLKKKCQEIAAARAYAMMESEKEKYQKFFEPGELPDNSNSYSFPNDLYKQPGAEVKHAEAVNLEVASKINEELRSALDPKELESFARQIACGMEHVSRLGIVHRDLAARNILLGERKVLKISDFGLSREGTYVKQTGGKIPFRWLSIEAIIERLYSTASDVWAFGIILWEICTLGNVPYPTVSDKDLKDFLLTGKRMEKEESCTDDIYEIMLKCWSHLPEDRPSFSELSKRLWDLEHEGNTYVNVERLMQESVDGQGDEDQKEVQKENNNIDDKSEEESYMRPNAGVDNLAYCLSSEDLNADDGKQLIRKKKKSTLEGTSDQAKGIFPERDANGITKDMNSTNAE